MPLKRRNAGPSHAATAWDVFIDTPTGERRIDTVFATGYDADEMRRSLIDHDGYDSRIYVREHDARAVHLDMPARSSARYRGPFAS